MNQLTTQQLHDLRIRWKNLSNPTVNKQIALQLLDECIRNRSLDERKGTLQPFRGQGDTFGLSGDYGA